MLNNILMTCETVFNIYTEKNRRIFKRIVYIEQNRNNTEKSTYFVT